jgi:CRP/FNR family transcriptional regulator, cyclic AMP receptor protein
MRLSRQTKLDLLKRIPLFAGCSRAELEAVSRVADEITIPAGRVLMRQGSPGRELIVLVQGEVTVERDGATIAVRRDGDYVGELPLVTGRPRTATVTAATDLQALVLDRTSFDRLLRDVPTMAVKVVKAVGERLPPEDT